MELAILILVFCVVAEFLLLKEIYSEYQEKNSLLKARTTALKNAELQISRIKRNKTQSEKFTRRIINIMNNEGTLVDKYDKIKELVDKLENGN